MFLGLGNQVFISEHKIYYEDETRVNKLMMNIILIH